MVLEAVTSQDMLRVQQVEFVLRVCRHANRENTAKEGVINRYMQTAHPG